MYSLESPTKPSRENEILKQHLYSDCSPASTCNNLSGFSGDTMTDQGIEVLDGDTKENGDQSINHSSDKADSGYGWVIVLAACLIQIPCLGIGQSW